MELSSKNKIEYMKHYYDVGEDTFCTTEVIYHALKNVEMEDEAYEMIKDFIEKKARVKMPAKEKFEYYFTTETFKSYCENSEYVSYESYTYDDDKKQIVIAQDYDKDIYLELRIFRKEYTLIYKKSWGE